MSPKRDAGSDGVKLELAHNTLTTKGVVSLFMPAETESEWSSLT